MFRASESGHSISHQVSFGLFLFDFLDFSASPFVTPLAPAPLLSMNRVTANLELWSTGGRVSLGDAERVCSLKQQSVALE